jgi:hypothetical protein
MNFLNLSGEVAPEWSHNNARHDVAYRSKTLTGEMARGYTT